VTGIDGVLGAFLEATGGEDPEALRTMLEGVDYDLPRYELLPQHPVDRRRGLELRAERAALRRRLAEIAVPGTSAGARRLARCRHYLEAAGYTVLPPGSRR
jgi:hypothetical protein